MLSELYGCACEEKCLSSIFFTINEKRGVKKMKCTNCDIQLNIDNLIRSEHNNDVFCRQCFTKISKRIIRILETEQAKLHKQQLLHELRTEQPITLHIKMQAFRKRLEKKSEMGFLSVDQVIELLETYKEVE